MKKWLLFSIALIVITIGLVYLFIPNFISFKSSVTLKANPLGVQRNLLEEVNWAGWWPKDASTVSTGNSRKNYVYDNYTYVIGEKRVSSILVNISNNDIKAITALNVLPIGYDSVGLSWDGVIATSYNPFRRLKIYFKSKEIQRDISEITDKMSTWFSKEENVYGFRIQNELVVDTTLISTYAPSENYPSTDFVYKLIDQLKNYIASQSAKETGAPMLNITHTDSVKYLVRVAIPVDKKLKPSGNISYRWMLGGGNIFTTEVKGGPYSVNRAIRQIENYMTEHRRMSPAIPFQSLITDRRAETDTSKWVTKIYYPVI
jgi:hypothetical protein